jgi:hypothetical protein
VAVVEGFLDQQEAEPVHPRHFSQIETQARVVPCARWSQAGGLLELIVEAVEHPVRRDGVLQERFAERQHALRAAQQVRHHRRAAARRADDK